MSRASNGTYTLPAGNPVVTATVISSAWANTTLSDIATEMTDSLDRSGKGGMLAALALVDGSVGVPSLTFTTEPTTGLYRPGAAQIALTIASTQRLLLTATDLTAPAFIPLSATVPVNGMYLPSANALGFSSNSVARGLVSNAGVWSLWEGTNNIAAAGLMQAATFESGTFVGTLTGCTTSPTQNFNYVRVGQIVTISLASSLSATSNANTLTVTGLPAALQPTRTQRALCILTDNSVVSTGYLQVSASTTITFAYATSLVSWSTAGFTAAGTKGVQSATTITYSLV